MAAVVGTAPLLLAAVAGTPLLLAAVVGAPSLLAAVPDTYTELVGSHHLQLEELADSNMP